MQITSLRDYLKDSTRRLHSQVEASPIMARMAPNSDETPTREDFIAFLQSQWWAYQHLENKLRPITVDPDLLCRLHKTSLIRADLEGLGAMPYCPKRRQAHIEPMSIHSEAQAMGVMYVLEGSSLGLGQIDRWIADRPFAQHSRRFTQGAGSTRATRWRAFIAQLNRIDKSHWNEAKLAAQACFRFFQQTLVFFEGRQVANRA